MIHLIFAFYLVSARATVTPPVNRCASLVDESADARELLSFFELRHPLIARYFGVQPFSIEKDRDFALKLTLRLYVAIYGDHWAFDLRSPEFKEKMRANPRLSGRDGFADDRNFESFRKLFAIWGFKSEARRREIVTETLDIFVAANWSVDRPDGGTCLYLRDFDHRRAFKDDKLCIGLLPHWDFEYEDGVTSRLFTRIAELRRRAREDEAFRDELTSSLAKRGGPTALPNVTHWVRTFTEGLARDVASRPDWIAESARRVVESMRARGSI